MLNQHFDAVERSLLATSQIAEKSGHRLHKGTLTCAASTVCRRSFSSALVLAVFWIFGHAGAVQAAKVIEACIEQNGKLILQGVYTADDRADTAEIWEDLSVALLKALQEISADPSDPQQITLTGDLRIMVTWGSPSLFPPVDGLPPVRKPLASAQLERLRLVRVADTSDQWQIPRDEVKRTAEAAGLQLHTSVLLYGVWFAGAIWACIVLGRLVWLFVRYLGRHQSSPT